MDDFKDLDQEINNLKKQLNFGGGAEGGGAFPEINDYWKRRLDEEKILFSKRLSGREEEKKTLELRISQQQAQIDQYHQVLKELEKKFDHESSQWEERLRIKEADLLLEKNRVLNEEKVKEAELETRRMLSQVAELNSRIARIRDEQSMEIGRLNENFSTERAAFEEKLKMAARHGELLEKRIKELEQSLAERNLELEKVKAEAEKKIRDAEAKIVTLTNDRAALEEEKQTLIGFNEEQKHRSAEEKRQLEISYRNLSRYFIENMRKYFGPLVGLAHFVSEHRVTAGTWNLFRDLIQKIDTETDSFSMQTNVTYTYNETFRVLVAMPDNEFSVWRSALLNTRGEVVRLAAQQLAREMDKAKPQVVIISGRSVRYARALRRRWPFVPVIISGSVEGNTAKALLAEGYPVIMPPYVIEEMVGAVIHAAGSSIAQPAYWETIAIKKTHTAPLLALGLVLVAAAVGYFGRTMEIPALHIPGFTRTTSFSTPYPQPTNLTYDGQYLWACDWMGQSIYKHKINGELGLVRIFYFPGKHFSALAWVKGNLWTVDPWEKKIYRHNSDEALTILSSYDAPGGAPSGLAGDGTVLWSCDASTGRIYRHKIDDKLSVEATFKSPGPNPSGLFYDGQSLWSADGQTNRIYRHVLDDQLSVAETFLPSGYEQKGYNISGIARNSKVFWVCSEKAGKIFQYSKDMLKKVTD